MDIPTFHEFEIAALNSYHLVSHVPRHCLRFLTQKLLYFAPLAYHSLTYRGQLIVTYVDNDPHRSKKK